MTPDPFLRLVDRVSDLSGRATSWLVLPLVLGVTYEVGARYLFNAPTVWAYELSYMLYASLFMLGAGYALAKGAHVRTDFLYNDFSERGKAAADAAGYVLFLPALVYYLAAITRQAWHSWQIGERSSDSPWAPILYPFKWMMVVGMALLLLQSVAELIRTLRTLRRTRRP